MKAAKFISPALGLFSILKKKPKVPQAVGPVSRDTVRDQMTATDALLRRRGGAADIVGGAYGAEGPPGGKITLGT